MPASVAAPEAAPMAAAINIGMNAMFPLGSTQICTLGANLYKFSPPINPIEY